jgi:threonine/homoserine/homoserine lactone efflux protein
MSTNDDPLSEPVIALRIYQHQQTRMAIGLIIIGVLSFVFCSLPIMGRETMLDRVNSLSRTAGAFSGGISALFVGLGIKLLLRPNPLVKLVLDLNDRVRKLETKN